MSIMQWVGRLESSRHRKGDSMQMTSTRSRWSLAVGLVVPLCGPSVPGTAYAQREVEMSAVRTRPRLQIRLEKIFTLRIDSVTGPQSAIFGFDSHKRVLIADYGAKRFVALELGGRVVTQYGREGRGPGEFWMGPVPCRTTTDSIYLWDHVSVTVLDPDFNFVRAVPLMLRAPFCLHRASSGFAGQARGPGDANGEPGYVRLFDSTGRETRMFRIEPERMKPGDWSEVRRDLRPAPDQTLWVFRFLGPSLEQWDTTGKRLARFSRKRDGLMAVQRGQKGTLQISSFAIDSQKRIWTIFGVPNGGTRSITFRTAGGANREIDREDFDLILEVADSKTGAILATHRLAAKEAYLVRPGVLVMTAETESGELETTLWTASLTPR
jgi:hypothetical protein